VAVEVQKNLKTDRGEKMEEQNALDERLPTLFEPDTLLPVQYFEAMRKKHLLEGEKRLILSVLEDAIECFTKGIDATTNRGQRLFREAEEWINHEDKRWVFSFDNVCDMLDINAEYMRLGMRRWKEKHLEALERHRAEVAAQAERAALAPAEPVPAAPPASAAPVVPARVAADRKRIKVAAKPAHQPRRRVRSLRVAKRRRTAKLRKARA
jgi:hypothetical protein